MSDLLHLRGKFIAVAMVSVTIVLIGLMVILNVASFVRIAEKADNTLEILVNNNGRFPKVLMVPKERQTRISPETPFESRFFSVLYDDENNVKVDTASIFAVDNARALAYAEKVKDRTKGYVDDYRFVNTGSLVVFLDCTRDLDASRSNLFTSSLICFFGLVCVFLLVLFFSKLATKPIEQAYAKQKRFITDASHEIKTPLTIIDANTDVIEMTSGESQWTKSTKAQIKRLTNLTKSLVELSRLDEGHALNQCTFCLSDAIVESLGDFEALALTKNKVLKKNIEENISYNADEQKIRKLIGILMDNAIKYSSEQGIIEISCVKKGKKVVLEVSNQVDQADIGPHNAVFDRFVRLDTSRSSSIPGYGLGLSMAYSIAQACKAKISAFSPDEKTFTVRLVL